MTTQRSTTGAVLLAAEGIRKTYTLGGKGILVLRGVDLQVRGGEAVAIVGASGAGKSTLLHVLGGLDTPDAGRVLFEGKDFYRMTQSERSAIRASRLGFVFQSYHLLPEMDVIENVMLPAMAVKSGTLSRPKMRARAEELLRAVGLGERVEHTPYELSGGEQQRAALARALMNDPQIILADEPTGNLDAKTGGFVLECLFELTRKSGRTLVMVTHNQEIARKCDRVLTLVDGVLKV